jgi:hypothetical protein
MRKDVLRYETMREPLASSRRFIGRLLASVLIAGALVGLSLLVGMWGYHHFEGVPWLDAFLEASMILSGMGLARALNTAGGKVFVGFYALYSGLILLLASGLILAPILHRLLHRFHLDSGA